jgi:hypothetical protein
LLTWILPYICPSSCSGYLKNGPRQTVAPWSSAKRRRPRRREARCVSFDRINAKGSSSAKGVTEEEGIVDVPSEEDIETVQSADEDNGDSMFTFEAYETVCRALSWIFSSDLAFSQRFANPDVNATLLTYLERYDEFDSPEKMKRVVSLLHRQAIKAKADSMFFKVGGNMVDAGRRLFTLVTGVNARSFPEDLEGGKDAPKRSSLYGSYPIDQICFEEVFQGRIRRFILFN